jgi:hypothetical protein
MCIAPGEARRSRDLQSLRTAERFNDEISQMSTIKGSTAVAVAAITSFRLRVCTRSYAYSSPSGLGGRQNCKLANEFALFASICS